MINIIIKYKEIVNNNNSCCKNNSQILKKARRCCCCCCCSQYHHLFILCCHPYTLLIIIFHYLTHGKHFRYPEDRQGQSWLHQQYIYSNWWEFTVYSLVIHLSFYHFIYHYYSLHIRIRALFLNPSCHFLWLLYLGTSGMQGWRLEMEDAHISADFTSKPDHLLLVIKM